MKKLIQVLLVLPMSLGLQACTPDEVATSAVAIGAVIIGAGVVASGATCHGGYVEKCTSYKKRHGREGRICRQEYDSCARIYRDSNSPMAVNKKMPTQSLSLQAANVAAKYHMSFESAEKVVAVIEAGKKADLSTVQSIGLTQSDLATLARGWKLSSSSIDRVSEALDMDLNSTYKMVADIEQKFKNPLEKNHDETGWAIGL